jgi:hypothetical protein
MMHQPIDTPRRRELELLLRLARDHDTCATEEARIEGDELVIPIDCHHRDGSWTIERERVRTREQLLDALGY